MKQKNLICRKKSSFRQTLAEKCARVRGAFLRRGVSEPLLPKKTPAVKPDGLPKALPLWRLLKAAPYFFAAFLLGISPIADNLMPFGLALLCVIPDKKRLAVFAGVLSASVFDECVPLYAFSAVFIYAVIELRRKSGGTPMLGRILLAASASLMRCVYISVCGVNDFYGIFTLIAAALSFPFFAFAFNGFFDKKKELRRHRYDISLLAFSFAFCLLPAQIEYGPVSLALLPATVFTLAFARNRGFAMGGACGIICGLCCGGAALGALGVMGMIYGLLAAEIESAALALSYMLAVTGFFYLNGISGTVEAMIIFIAGYAVFLPLRKKIKPLPSASAEKRAFDRKISRYAATFSSLSSLFYAVSDNARVQTVTELNAGIVSAVDYYCSRCEGCELDKSEISNFFTSEVRRNGVAVYSRIPSHVSARCPNACAMARSVNSLPLVKEKEAEKGLKRMADEYSSFSAILADAAKRQESAARADKSVADSVKKELKSINVGCDGVRVTGSRLRDVTVYGVSPADMQCSPNDISAAVALATGTKMSPPELVPHDGYILLKTHSVPRFRIEVAKLTEAKNGEKVCGDTVSTFENDERFFYCLISDGMGSGRDAALTSRLACIMLEKLLTVGAEKENAIKLLNKALCEKDEEIFATIDLLEIDRINATATLIKAGAAPSYILRDGHSGIIEAKTPPAGIMKKVVAEKRTFSLKSGDLIVMMSDGVMQTGSGEEILPADGIPPMPSARALAEMLVSDSRKRHCSADDASVCVLRII